MAPSTRTLLKIIISLIFVVIIGTPLFFIRTSVYPEVHSKMLFFQSVIEIMFFLWLSVIVVDKRFRVRWTPLTIALVVFAAALLLTAFTGVDFSRSFWSTQARSLGVVTFLHAIAFSFVLASLRKEIPWQKLFVASLATSMVVCAIAFIQTKAPGILISQESVSSAGRPGLTFGNPSFMAGYLLFHVFIAGWLLVERVKSAEKRKISIWEKGFYAIAIGMNVIAIVLSQTRGAMIGLGVGMFAFLALLAFFSGRKRVVRATIAVFAITMMCIVFFVATHAHPFWKRVPIVNRFQELISFQNFSQAFLPRIAALSAAGSGILERPVVGWGWENFNVVFDKFYNPRTLSFGYTETRFDKPHNYVLEYFVAGGVLVGGAFIGILLALLYELFVIVRRKSILVPVMGYGVFAATVAIFVNNFFIFETLGALMMTYFVFGWVDAMYRNTRDERELVVSKHQKKDATMKKKTWGFGVAGATLLAIIFVYYFGYLPTLAARYQALGFLSINNDPIRGMDFLRKAKDISQPYQWIVMRDFAMAASQTYFYNSDVVPPDIAKEGLRAMEQVVAEHPNDAYNHYAFVDIYNQVSDIDPDRILPLAEKEAARALELSPNRQEVLFSLAKTKTLKGDKKAALEILGKAVLLNDNAYDAHFYYGLLLFENSDPKKGYDEIKRAIALGKKWKNYFEPRVVAAYFADSGHLDEAIDLYKVALAMSPGDIDTNIKLGVAYFFGGEKILAKQILEDISKQFDFTKSPSYGQLKPILDELGVPY